MIALYHNPHGFDEAKAHHAAASLALFAPAPAFLEVNARGFYAQLPAVGSPAPSPRRRRAPVGWRARRSAAGCVVLFHGTFDNAAAIAAELQMPDDDPAMLYAAAVEQWGDAAEARILGAYCAIIQAGDGSTIRLARSPLFAPPLHYFQNGDETGVASSPRVLVAMGLAPRLNQRKLADALYLNLTEREGFYQGAFRVGIGEVVHMQPGRAPRFHTSFDFRTIRPARRGDPREYLPEADRLLTEAITVATKGMRQPGVSLSGGLDSSNVAARLLRILPENQRLKSFTLAPLPGWQPTQEHKLFGDETTYVRAFAAMHPRLEPHFSDAAGHDFDTDLEKFFLAMGTCQPNFPIAFRFQALLKEARAQGCDMLVASDMGNFTFSNDAPWSYAEYLRRGRWVQAWRALKNIPHTQAPMHWRLLSWGIMPMLPDKFWHTWRRWRGRQTGALNADIALLHRQAHETYGVGERARAANVEYEREMYGSRARTIAEYFSRGDDEVHDYAQAAEQIHQIRWRDAVAYRPLVEFCLALPSDAFMRDGQNRWLARELGRGLIPETQRKEVRHGYPGADWHMRMTPRLTELRAELERASTLPELQGIVDFDRARQLLDSWPAASSLDHAVVGPYAFSLIRTLSIARYVRFVTGQNG